MVSDLIARREAVSTDLRHIYDVLHCILDTHEDEGDRCYFGSTNDPHTMKRMLRHLDAILTTLEASDADTVQQIVEVVRASRDDAARFQSERRDMPDATAWGTAKVILSGVLEQIETLTAAHPKPQAPSEARAQEILEDERRKDGYKFAKVMPPTAIRAMIRFATDTQSVAGGEE